MNITRAFVEYMEGLGLGTFADDIFIGGAPLNSEDAIWWVIGAGGNSDPKNSTGERIKNYTLDVFYRDTNAEEVYDKMQILEEEVNSKECTELEGYETVDMEAALFPADQDIDNEDRTVGLLQVTLTVYQS